MTTFSVLVEDFLPAKVDAHPRPIPEHWLRHWATLILGLINYILLHVCNSFLAASLSIIET